MKFLQTLRAVMISLVILGFGGLSNGGEKQTKLSGNPKEQGTVHTVQAGVVYPTNAGTGIQAEKQPGQFTIPKGSLGAKLKYSFADPKSGYTSTKLRGSNIYSVTEKRYMHELEHNPDFALPPGDYKFVVGGSPGASGTLVYTVVPDSGVQPPPGGTPRDPPTRKPPSGTPGKDTSKIGSGSATLHPGGEGVLLNLPGNFDVVCNELWIVGAGVRGKDPTITADNPLVFRFRNGAFTVEHKAVQRHEAQSSERREQVTISGTLSQGRMTGEYQSVHKDYAVGDPAWPDGYFNGELRCKGQLTGQSNADGKVKVVVAGFSVTAKGRHYSRENSAAMTGRITPQGDWEDKSHMYADFSKYSRAIALQLPVGQLQSTQKFIPNPSSRSPTDPK